MKKSGNRRKDVQRLKKDSTEPDLGLVPVDFTMMEHNQEVCGNCYIASEEDGCKQRSSLAGGG